MNGMTSTDMNEVTFKYVKQHVKPCLIFTVAHSMKNIEVNFIYGFHNEAKADSGLQKTDCFA